MKVRAINDYVVIKANNVHDTTESGVVMVGELPAPCSGVVHSAPEHYYDKNDHKRDMPVKKGDNVIFAANVLRTEEDGDDTYVWMNIENVIGVSYD